MFAMLEGKADNVLNEMELLEKYTVKPSTNFLSISWLWQKIRNKAGKVWWDLW